MSWTVVARKDFDDARRSRTLWALSAVFLGLAVLVSGVYGYVPDLSGAERLSTVGLLGFLASPVTLFVSVAALVACHKSIAGETETGSGKLLLGLAHTRRDVFVGKVVGRSLVLALPVLAGLAAMLVVVFAAGVPFSPTDYVLFTLVTLFFVLVYVTVFVGVSASTTSTSRAATVGVLLLVVFEFAWDVVPLGAWFVASGFEVPEGFATGNLAAMPDRVAFLNNVPPSGAYQIAIGGVFSGSMSSAEPFYLQQWFGIVILVVWALVPAVIGYLRYQRADL
jgi:ABC-2 type transport system permease protein